MVGLAILFSPINHSDNKTKIPITNEEALQKSGVFNYNLDEITTKLEWNAGDFLPHFTKYKTYHIDVNAKTIDWMDLLETAAKNTGPQIKAK